MDITIVSTDRVLTEMLQDFLLNCGHMIYPVESSPGAGNTLEQLKTKTDLLLYDLNGHSQCFSELKAVHSSYPDLPIIAMTSISNVLPCDEALSSGVLSYLRKPISLSELGLLVARIKESGELL
ncbi:MAG: hypothetical protein K9J81_06305 [Desulfohalobiaceae bacterium]|nr:hypothetical protein [Desulfohalobiaceae bacterium]